MKTKILKITNHQRNIRDPRSIHYSHLQPFKISWDYPFKNLIIVKCFTIKKLKTKIIPASLPILLSFVIAQCLLQYIYCIVYRINTVEIYACGFVQNNLWYSTIFIINHYLWIISALPADNALLENFWRISLHVTNDAIAKLYVMQSLVYSNKGKWSKI